MSTKIKQIVIVVVILLIGFVLIQMIFGGDSTSESATVSVETNESGLLDGEEILRLLRSLDSISLSDDLSRNPIFNSLTNNSVALTPGNFGRANPFLPVSLSGGASVSSSFFGQATSTLPFFNARPGQ